METFYEVLHKRYDTSQTVEVHVNWKDFYVMRINFYVHL